MPTQWNPYQHLDQFTLLLLLSGFSCVPIDDSVRPHRRQPMRHPRPWDSPSKNTGVGCHFLLHEPQFLNYKWGWCHLPHGAEVKWNNIYHLLIFSVNKLVSIITETKMPERIWAQLTSTGSSVLFSEKRMWGLEAKVQGKLSSPLCKGVKDVC